MRETQQRVDAGETFDVAVIGAGVIGCAMARRFTLEGARVVVLEKAADVLDGASKANSAILHTGFDAPSDSLELACIRAGYAEYLEIRQSLNLPLFESGAMVLAWNAEQLAALPELMEQARRNGVMDAQLLDSQQVLGLEPHLSPEVLGGFRVPGESLIDPWSAPHAYLTQALLNGARLELGWALSSARFENHRWLLESPRGAVRARSVINCAGLHGDTVEALLLGRAEFAIRPRKGQFVVYDKSAARLLKHILLPVPTKITKGIVVCRTVFGNVLVGPTAEEQDEREVAALDQPTLETLRQRGGEILPALRDQPVTALYAGLRPASQAKEYQIRAEADWRYIAVGGIRSTGLSSALGTAQHV
ncbi:NAD(P)/FAD-dependent oxidoreductase, partial [Pseudomonas sp.]|uniref:NAD(P)/FAD-dependent oxidoreductase n=1 Tax=Pseudomonas sp. TaxID=306 RepID=UPI0028AB673B